MLKILAINGSYRPGGITDQSLEYFRKAAEQAGAEVETIVLRDRPIEFCVNCRACTQLAGEKPGQCVLQDLMEEFIENIELADVYILASPTNFYSVTALFKRFMERLIPYTFWSWGMNAPKLRKAGSRKKKAIIVSSCAAPAIIARLVYGTGKQLKLTAKTMGADVAGSLFVGMISNKSQPELPEHAKKKIVNLMRKLV